MVTSPQDEGDEEDDVGDQDEDVPEGEPPPHCLRPKTQKQNWFSIPTDSHITAILSGVIGLDEDKTNEKAGEAILSEQK